LTSPWVNISYNRYRVELLKLGVNLYEVSKTQLRRDHRMRELFKKARMTSRAMNNGYRRASM